MVSVDDGVYRIAKVRFWKQFTTIRVHLNGGNVVFTVLQRYDFESNSQLHHVYLSGCGGVYRIAKVRFWKQFTTIFHLDTLTEMVFTVLQRYDFESNSQRSRGNGRIYVWCLPYCKGTILKAIHNSSYECSLLVKGVYRIAKVRFWKQFTTCITFIYPVAAVFTVLQRYDFESNSQQGLVATSVESRCLPYCKGTILKAIHNKTNLRDCIVMVFTVLQRYDFESNSQQDKPQGLYCYRCLPYCKGTILKAIHNWNFGNTFTERGVYRIAKVRFWKQFTTQRGSSTICSQVFTVLQRYDFECNSQHVLPIIVITSGVYPEAKVQFRKQFTSIYFTEVVTGKCKSSNDNEIFYHDGQFAKYWYLSWNKYFE